MKPFCTSVTNARLHAEGFLLALVRIQAGGQVEPTAFALEVVDELVDGNVILGGIGQVFPEIDDIAIFI